MSEASMVILRPTPLGLLRFVLLYAVGFALIMGIVGWFVGGASLALSNALIAFILVGALLGGAGLSGRQYLGIGSDGGPARPGGRRLPARWIGGSTL
jgi:hypothetical protein